MLFVDDLNRFRLDAFSNSVGRGSSITIVISRSRGLAGERHETTYAASEGDSVKVGNAFVDEQPMCHISYLSV